MGNSIYLVFYKKIVKLLTKTKIDYMENILTKVLLNRMINIDNMATS